MIPKIIHYCWFGKNPLPKEVILCIESWKKHCPDYEIIEWNENNYDVYKTEFLKTAYENKKWAFVSDYARLDIIYNNGGIYLDTDVELLKSLDSLLENSAYFGIEQQNKYIQTGIGFGAEKQHTAIFEMLKQYDSLVYTCENESRIICPILNTNALLPFGYDLEDREQFVCEAHIYPSFYFDPLAPGEEDLLCDYTISIHRYDATWTSTTNRLKRKIMNKIGMRNIKKIKKILFNK